MVLLFAALGLVRWRFRNLDSIPILQKNGRLRLTLCAIESRAEVFLRFAIAFFCSSQWARSSACNETLVQLSTYTHREPAISPTNKIALNSQAARETESSFQESPWDDLF